jgi:hypothetical protein
MENIILNKFPKLDINNIVLKPEWLGIKNWTKCNEINLKDKIYNMELPLDYLENKYPYYNELTEYINNNAVFIKQPNFISEEDYYKSFIKTKYRFILPSPRFVLEEKDKIKVCANDNVNNNVNNNEYENEHEIYIDTNTNNQKIKYKSNHNIQVKTANIDDSDYSDIEPEPENNFTDFICSKKHK